MFWGSFFADPVSVLPRTAYLRVGFRVGKCLLELRFFLDTWCRLVLVQIKKLGSQIFPRASFFAHLVYSE